MGGRDIEERVLFVLLVSYQVLTFIMLVRSFPSSASSVQRLQNSTLRLFRMYSYIRWVLWWTRWTPTSGGSKRGSWMREKGAVGEAK